MRRSEVIELICLLIMGAIFSGLVGAMIATMIMDENKTVEEPQGWNEAAIIVDGEEIVRGQLDDYSIKNNMATIIFADGNEWTTTPENVMIMYHPYN